MNPIQTILGATLEALPKTLVLTYLFILGAMVGSFLNVVIARLPAGESVVRPRSKCPKCGDMIPFWLNIPILSWLILRGKCRACKTPISLRYPVVELLTAILFTACGSKFGVSWATLSGVILCGMLVAITFIDIDIWEIPDEISLPGILIGCILRPIAFEVPWYDGILGAAMGAGFLWLIRFGFYLLRGVEGMGMGDIKLIGTIGAFVGPIGLVPTILVSSVSGTIIGIIVLLFSKQSEEEKDEAETSTLQSHDREDLSPLDDETSSSAIDEANEMASVPQNGEEEEEEWVPPKNAVPFGPFLSLGAIATFLMADDFRRLFLSFI